MQGKNRLTIKKIPTFPAKENRKECTVHAKRGECHNLGRFRRMHAGIAVAPADLTRELLFVNCDDAGTSRLENLVFDSETCEGIRFGIKSSQLFYFFLSFCGSP